MKIILSTIILLILTLSCGNTETNLDEDNFCYLSNGERVEDSWSGNDKGGNFCNTCECMSGNLVCTEMACQIDTPEPTPEPTQIKKNSSGEMKYNHPKITGEVEEVVSLIDELTKATSNSENKFTIFLKALELTGMDKEITLLKEMTILVPSDNVFLSKFNEVNLNNLITDIDLLTKIIESHLLPYEFKEKNMKKFSHLDTFAESLKIEVINKKTVINEGIYITSADNEVTNGYFHVIDSIIVPEEDIYDSQLNNSSEDAKLITLSEIIGKRLFVDNLVKEDAEYNFNSDFTLTIQLDNDGNYSGKFLCNNIFGNYNLSEEGYLKISEGGSTKMFCIPPSDNVEMNTQEIWEFLLNEDIEIFSSGDNIDIYFRSSSGYLSLKEN
ncbi:MAG: hypothetical protein CL762_04900 [Chloroflexi bacterium]|nr:hypothetical protein [Chloroflexota bacterium]